MHSRVPGFQNGLQGRAPVRTYCTGTPICWKVRKSAARPVTLRTGVHHAHTSTEFPIVGQVYNLQPEAGSRLRNRLINNECVALFFLCLGHRSRVGARAPRLSASPDFRGGATWTETRRADHDRRCSERLPYACPM